MFLGEYQHTLDAKGRLSLPAKFRSEMTGSLVVAKGLEGCLYVFSSEDYARFLKQLTEKGDFDPKFRQVRRFFTAGAKEDQLDTAGRMGIPVVLREYAKLDRDVAVIGNGDRIELWDAATWAAYNGETEARIEEVTSELAELGIL
ncbi:MAG: division/cell wall cluster transcriptional repressor MraZ [Coriobacteriia bacterium]|jgi:MraZ protein|nr:division/cell wall cluster transcriptional repressor MraZ [Coriobacteriia bacterium]MDP2300726.1 division/cell wall cluster transcriptional repressor MraZ [Actinomycetota bacterium]MDZ4166262.1 division/cell wall cluster transcriptional repressor MraZ [Coriobacteriia bacterium]